MKYKMKNVTFSLPEEIIEKYKEYAKNEYIPSINSGVREALEEYSRKIEKEKFRNEMIKASTDPLFLKDIEESMKAYKTSDSEINGGTDEW